MRKKYKTVRHLKKYPPYLKCSGTAWLFLIQIIVEAFQEDSIGEFKLYDGTVLWIGHNQAGVDILSKQNSLIFEPGMLPLSAGTFKIRFIATFKNEQSEKTCYSPSYSFSIQNPTTAL